MCPYYLVLCMQCVLIMYCFICDVQGYESAGGESAGAGGGIMGDTLDRMLREQVRLSPAHDRTLSPGLRGA